LSTDKIDKIIDKYVNEEGVLIQLLLDIQREFNWIPKTAIKRISERLDIPYSKIFRVASFYAALSLKPIGRHCIQVCSGTACHVRGAQMIAEEFERQLEIKPGETTPNREFTLETVNCLGACALGPIVVVDGHYFSNVMRSQVKQIVREASFGLDKVQEIDGITGTLIIVDDKFGVWGDYEIIPT